MDEPLNDNDGAQIGDAPLTEVKAKFTPFLVSNPKSAIEQFTVREAPLGFEILSPWGDKSLALRLPDDMDRFAAIMNSIVLPERLSAIWHRDKGSLEFIWTAFTLSKNWKEVRDRKFDFRYGGITHSCHFTKSSDDLLRIAKQMRQKQNSNTSFRNLDSYKIYSQMAENNVVPAELMDPLSFWVSNIQAVDNNTIDMLRNLNFFLTYYDFASPVILIHDVEELLPISTKLRYIKGKFPVDITGRPLDPNLLSFWTAANSANAILRFILYYRIIEYAAFHFIDDKIRLELKKLLAAPDLASEINTTVDSIVSTVTVSKLEDVQRFSMLVTQKVDARLIWKEVKKNIDVFTKPVFFDGGFMIDALVTTSDNETTFCGNGMIKLCHALRKLRNTLSHGKDQETAGVITPTARNFYLLAPWIHLIATAAGEVMLFKDF